MSDGGSLHPPQPLPVIPPAQPNNAELKVIPTGRPVVPVGAPIQLGYILH